LKALEPTRKTRKKKKNVRNRGGRGQQAAMMHRTSSVGTNRPRVLKTGKIPLKVFTGSRTRGEKGQSRVPGFSWERKNEIQKKKNGIGEKAYRLENQAKTHLDKETKSA